MIDVDIAHTHNLQVSNIIYNRTVADTARTSSALKPKTESSMARQIFTQDMIAGVDVVDSFHDFGDQKVVWASGAIWSAQRRNPSFGSAVYKSNVPESDMYPRVIKLSSTKRIHLRIRESRT